MNEGGEKSRIEFRSNFEFRRPSERERRAIVMMKPTRQPTADWEELLNRMRTADPKIFDLICLRLFGP